MSPISSQERQAGAALQFGEVGLVSSQTGELSLELLSTVVAEVRAQLPKTARVHQRVSAQTAEVSLEPAPLAEVVVHEGQCLFELSGVSVDEGRRLLVAAAARLPVSCAVGVDPELVG